MKTRELYDANDKYTADAMELDLRFCVALKAIYDEARRAGFGARDLAALMHSAVQDVVCTDMVCG